MLLRRWSLAVPFRQSEGQPHQELVERDVDLWSEVGGEEGGDHQDQVVGEDLC